MDPGDEIGAFSHLGAVLVAPLHPLVISVDCFHRFTVSIACHGVSNLNVAISSKTALAEGRASSGDQS